MPEPDGKRKGLEASLEEALPRSIFVPESDPRKAVREMVDAILSDRFMAFLSILIVPIIIVPFFVSLPDFWAGILNSADVVVITFFVAEYVLKVAAAEDRRAYVRQSWHLLDLLVVILSIVSFLPIGVLEHNASAFLLLRLLRLPRAFAVGARVSGRKITEQEGPQAAPPPARPLVIRQVNGARPGPAVALSWDELEQHLATSDPEWLALSNVDEAAGRKLTSLLRVQAQHLRLGQVDEIYPHVRRMQSTVILFLQSGEVRYPRVQEESFNIASRGVVIALTASKIISVSPHGIDLTSKVALSPETGSGGTSFQLTILHALLENSLEEYRSLFSEIELEARRIVDTPRSKLPSDFLTRMYQMNRAALRLASNLTHFKELIGRVASQAVPVEGMHDRAKEGLESLVDEASFLGEVADDVTESLQAIIDVYINQSSFDTNRFLKFLAVVTTLAVLPATVGGLLGVNPPFSNELWTLTAALLLSMLFVTYCFAKLGFLKA